MLHELNSRLQTAYVAIEDCSDGLAYSHLVNLAHPNGVPVESLNYEAVSVEDNFRNLTILQTAMDEIGLGKRVPIRLLAQGDSDAHQIVWFR
mmetsp:Transcript_114936/g.263957  ORF Transcript_114936/g.263957 Transcript_114936/m.263957 type:complete len:92 (-) Transcript_114936:360-635(-)